MVHSHGDDNFPIHRIVPIIKLAYITLHSAENKHKPWSLTARSWKRTIWTGSFCYLLTTDQINGASTSIQAVTNLHQKFGPVNGTITSSATNKNHVRSCTSFNKENSGAKSLQGGPLPVLSRVITPFIGVITPVTYLQGHLHLVGAHLVVTFAEQIHKFFWQTKIKVTLHRQFTSVAFLHDLLFQWAHTSGINGVRTATPIHGLINR